MSVSEYDALAAEVGARNRAREEAAVEALRRQGFELANDVGRLVLLEHDEAQRCTDAQYGPSSPDVDSEPMEVKLGAPSGTSGPSTVFLAALEQACEFFSNRTDSLDGVIDGGDAVHFVRVPGPFARNREGELFLLEMHVEVISRRTVLVERTCNEMPSPPMSPFESPQGWVVPAPAPAPTQRVRMSYGREELDIECTDIVQ